MIHNTKTGQTDDTDVLPCFLLFAVTSSGAALPVSQTLEQAKAIEKVFLEGKESLTLICPNNLPPSKVAQIEGLHLPKPWVDFLLTRSPEHMAHFLAYTEQALLEATQAPPVIVEGLIATAMRGIIESAKQYLNKVLNAKPKDILKGGKVKADFQNN